MGPKSIKYERKWRFIVFVNEPLFFFVCANHLFSVTVCLHLLPSGIKLTNQLANSIYSRPSVTQIVKIFLPFLIHKGSVLHSQKHATGPYPESDETIIFPQHLLFIIILSVVRFSKRNFPLDFSDQSFVCISPLLDACCMLFPLIFLLWWY
jgi:hypothetical protein